MSDWELEGLTGYMEDQVADLRRMLRDLPHDAFASEQNRRTFSRLRGVAIDLTAMYLAANTIAHEPTNQPKEMEPTA